MKSPFYFLKGIQKVKSMLSKFRPNTLDLCKKELSIFHFERV